MLGALATALSGCATQSQSPTRHAGVVERPAPRLAPAQHAARLHALTAALLARQDAAYAGLDRTRFLAGWAPSPESQRQAGTVYAGLTGLGVTGVRSVAGSTSLRLTPGGWTVSVAVTWTLPGWAPVTSRLCYRLTRSAASVRVVGVSASPGADLPPWLLPGLVVRRGPGYLVAGTDPGLVDRVVTLAPHAVQSVRAVLTGWGGRLLVYAPGTLSAFDELLDAKPGDYRGIAGVTTTADGSLRMAAPNVVVLDPVGFAALDVVGAEVVLAHEATHAATQAAAATMPTWVGEGFADYVGMRSAGLSRTPRRAARHALAAARRDGVPSRLPSDAAFARSGPALEVSYEQAWLATSLIARRYGTAQLVAFYRAVEGHPDALGAAFSSVLGTSEAAFTRLWRVRISALLAAPGHSR